jgi:hypothetical protein
VAADQGFRLLGPPGSEQVEAYVGRVVEQRLHNAPGLLDAVLSGEELMVAGDRGVQQALVRLRRFAELAGERGVQGTGRQDCSASADSCSRRPGSGSIRSTIWLGPALVGRERKASRGSRRRNSRTSVTLRGSALPARRKTGTSAQRQLSISSRSAT